MNNIYSSINSDTTRILAQGVEVSNNTWATGLNNNDLVIGPSGAGKTRGYVKPNILQCNESMIIADTKGNLQEQVGPVLERNGYKVHRIDLKDLDRCTIGYNPMDYIGEGPGSEQDIMTLAQVIVPDANRLSDPFWDNAARMYVASLLAYIVEAGLPDEERSLCTVPELLRGMAGGASKTLLKWHMEAFPDGLASKLYGLYRSNSTAEKMHASIVGIASERFTPFMLSRIGELFRRPDRISFRDLGREKTAVFLCISDTDRSLDRVVSFFYTQALHALCRSADTEYPGQCLPVPVRFILDDFATNALVPNFQEITSVIRSRGISVSIILQSLRQLTSIYGESDALTIANNCDHWLYLGGQDLYTAQQIARMINKLEYSVLKMKPHQVYVLSRGSEAQCTTGYDIESHPRWKDLGGAAPKPLPRGICPLDPISTPLSGDCKAEDRPLAG